MKKALMFARSFGGFHPADVAYDLVAAELERRGIARVEKATETAAFLALSGYDLLIVYSDLGDLNPEEEAALVAWVEAGGGLTAIHGAAAGFKENEDYHLLLGADFVSHPPLTTSTVTRSDLDHMITRRLPQSSQVEDELYLTNQRADFRTLLEANFLGRPVPIAWVRTQGKGRVFYNALGHNREAMSSPVFLDLCANGSRWALGQEPGADVRVGVVGYGGAFGMGHLHGSLVSATPGMHLTWACDLDPARASVAAQDWPEARVTTDPAEMAAAEDLDLAVVIVPHNVHAAVAGQFLEAGKNVMVEKPFTITGAEARDLIEQARERNLTLTVFHNRRWDRDFMAVQEVVRSGRIGDPFLFEAFLAGFGHPGYWWRSDEKVSGGLMHDWGAHGVDWALNLLDDEVDQVTAWSQKRKYFDVSNADFAKLVAHTKGGRLMDIEFGGLSASRKAYMRILGTKGAIEVRPPNRDLGANILIYREREHGLAEELRPYRSPARRGQTGPHPWAEWSAVDELYRRLADHFILGDPAPVTPESAGRVIGVIEAAKRSAESGKPEPPTYW